MITLSRGVVMYNYKNFGESPIHNALSYFYYFISVNILFTLSNLLFIISLIVLKLELQNLIFFIIALIPTGPSLTALFSVMGKLVREKDIYPFKDYWNAYKLNFKATMKVWSIQLFLLLVIIVDIRYMSTANNISFIFIKPLILIAATLVSISIYLYAILSRFDLKTKDLIKLSFFYTFKRLPSSVVNMIILGISIYFAFFKLPILIPFIAGIIVYIMMFRLSSVLKEIEENIIVTS